MIKTKIIDNGSKYMVEDAINSFIANPSNRVKEVRDIKFTSTYEGGPGLSHSALIIYEER